MTAVKPVSTLGGPVAARRTRRTTASILRRAVIVVLAVLAGALFDPGLRATVESDKAKDEECRRFVQQFYRWYAGADFDSSGISDSLDDVLDQELFSRDLADQLDDVLDAEDQHDDVWLTFDPVLNGKHQWDSYTAGTVTRKGEHFLVGVYGVRHGRRNNNPDVVAELVFQIGRWTFVNFHYPNRADSPTRENLLSVLKEIRKSHPVKPHARRSEEPQAMRLDSTISASGLAARIIPSRAILRCKLATNV